MQRPFVLIVTLLFTFSMHSKTVAESAFRLHPGEKLNKTIGSTKFQLAHTLLSGDTGKQLLVATLAFDEDVRIQRNELPAGEYEIAVEVAKKNRVHFVFRTGDDELFRYAVRIDKGDPIESPTIRLEI